MTLLLVSVDVKHPVSVGQVITFTSAIWKVDQVAHYATAGMTSAHMAVNHRHPKIAKASFA